MRVDDEASSESRWNLEARFAEAGMGALAGLAFAGFLLAVGAGRAIIAAVRVTLGGHEVPLPTASDARVIAVYVGAFVVGGAVLGLIAPLLRAHFAKVLAGLVLGAAGMGAVGAADGGPQGTVDRTKIIAYAVTGAFFGALGGLVWGSAGHSKRSLEQMDRLAAEIDATVARRRRARERARPRQPPTDSNQ